MLKKWCLMEGAWSCYRGGQYNGGRILITEVASLKMRENGHVTEVVGLVDGEWSCYRGDQFKEGRMVVIEVASNGGGMVMFERWPV